MPAPSNTYNSNTDLSLGQVPQVDDPELYQELLDLHNAIEALLTSSDEGDSAFQEFLSKFRNRTNLSLGESPYTVQVTDGTLRVDATAGSVVVILHPVSEGIGYRYDVKRVDTTVAARNNTVTLLGDSALEQIDGHVGGILISQLDSYTVKAHSAGWDII